MTGKQAVEFVSEQFVMNKYCKFVAVIRRNVDVPILTGVCVLPFGEALLSEVQTSPCVTAYG